MKRGVNLPANRAAWQSIVEHVVVSPTTDGWWMALVDRGRYKGLAMGRTEGAARQSLRRRLFSALPRERNRPYLRLCTPCNKRAHALGEAQYSDGVDLCAECAAAVDAFIVERREWEMRVKRNRRKHRGRQRRRRR